MKNLDRRRISGCEKVYKTIIKINNKTKIKQKDAKIRLTLQFSKQSVEALRVF